MSGRRADEGISLAELGSSLERAGRKPVYLALGEDACLRERAVVMIRRHGDASRSKDDPPDDLPGADAADGGIFSCETLYGDETSAQDVVSRAREVPFFGGHRVLLLQWADKLSPREGEALLSYVAAPSDFTTLIVSAGKLDGRMRWVQACKKQAVVVQCALSDNQRPGWIRREAARLGLRLEPEAEGLLHDMGGEGLDRVRRELEKLALYVSEGAAVTARDVVAVQGKEPGASVFDLSGAMAHGRVAAALLILQKTLEADEPPLRILGALLWQYRRLWKACDGLHRGLGEAAVARSLGVYAFGQRELCAVARRIPPAHFPTIFARFAETDRALKGAAAHAPRRIMHALIFGLCRLAQSVPAGTRAPMTPTGRPETGARGAPSKPVSGL